MTHVTGPWRKSSRSGQSNGTACVEARAVATWRKSSRSGQSNGTNCVEARLVEATFQLRDSKLGDGSPTLAMTNSDWRGLLTLIRR
ncbi:DUF397 domain-containing protein [Stackebrandtia nassauensis]|uniref:DUF397 domain-containing protein n=1 Tax=Stackebrandtia nassauensis (strain DSM 44728 / CIP 108903 / NRRL B-16338 / NBRC 102104 / LLR-40K-21) TaxID=446470 RepID=D3Q3P8_STANL|nr:DUF397 domain-containing protein [Stackebrandtia nassauensis]ADD43965.1 protein of unknown function DUF397 [Stackebrandtia nassauensis DSM 44728]